VAGWLTLATATSAHAGAWTQNAGGWFVKLGLEQWETEERFGLDASLEDFLPPGAGFARRGDYRNQALRFYAEHGITSHWTVTAATALERARVRGDGRIIQQTGLSDLTLQLKRRITAAPVVISAIAEAKLPTGYDMSQAPALGSGRIDGGGRLAVGRGFGAAYVSGEAGYRLRGGRSSEFPFAFETGITMMGKVMLRAELSGVGTRNLPVAGTSFDPARAESRHVSGGLGLVLLGDPLDFVLSADQVVWGRNSLAGTRFSFSVWRAD
jgi:hypothetical protein